MLSKQKQEMKVVTQVGFGEEFQDKGIAFLKPPNLNVREKGIFWEHSN